MPPVLLPVALAPTFASAFARMVTPAVVGVVLNGSLAACDARHDTTTADTLAVLSIARPDTLPDIASWLTLRKAAATRDSAARAALYETVDLPVARDRIPWIEAQARETSGDLVGALRLYQTLPAPVHALRVRFLLAARDSASAATPSDSATAVRADALRLIGSNADASDVRETIALFDKMVHDPTAAEQLAIGRGAATIGLWKRARQGFEAADHKSPLAAADRFLYATALSHTGSQSDAATQFARVTAPRGLAAAAQYQRARILLASGKSTAALRQLRALEHAFPRDTSAALSLWLRADLASDVNNDGEARTLWRQLANQFPRMRLTQSARFNAALVDFIQGNLKTAAREFSALAPTMDDFSARYWLGRTAARRGDSAAARRAWRTIVTADSMSYYATLAARRLGADTPFQHIDTTAITYPHVPSVDSAAHRIAELRILGMGPELRIESARLFHDAPATRDRLLATAAAFAGTEESSRAIALGRRALSSYGASPAIYRLMYPIAARDTLVNAARRSGVDPVLVAALIRQESNFNPSAISAVGARGLMQVMPSVAEGIATSLQITPWSSTRLYDPGVNIMIGVAHLAPLLRAQPNVVRVLAAYNAGESRVARWAKKAGADDPELFTERIPFPETRDYVKNIVRNREIYRALYTW